MHGTTDEHLPEYCNWVNLCGGRGMATKTGKEA